MENIFLDMSKRNSSVSDRQLAFFPSRDASNSTKCTIPLVGAITRGRNKVVSTLKGGDTFKTGWGNVTHQRNRSNWKVGKLTRRRNFKM